jgi:hypothetical protein
MSLIIVSCSSIRVSNDFDSQVDFSNYKTYAFSKKGIDKAQINDLDKKRILKAIEVELSSIGFRKNAINPDVIVSIFTGSDEQINVYNSQSYFGYGWGPWYDFNYNSTTRGVLYIDIVDNIKNQLVWQGVGKGYISENNSKKEEQIKAFVNKILLQYPSN